MLPSFSYIPVRSLDEAVDHLTGGDARIHAGGTDLLGCLRDGVLTATKVVSLSGLDELRGIRIEAGTAHIGALTTIAEITASPMLQQRWPGLTQAAGEVASPQLRNQGTLGGNLCQKPRCWYYRGDFHCLRKGGPECFALDGQNQYHCIFGESGCCIVHPSDTAPALIALGARVHTSVGRDIDVEALFMSPADDVTRETVLTPNEIITEVIVPTAPSYTSYRKVRARRSWDFALAGVALALEMTGKNVRSGRVVLSGVAPIPWRATAVERVITGASLDAATIKRAAAAAVAGAQSLGNNGYKIPLVRGMIEEELTRAAAAA